MVVGGGAGGQQSRVHPADTRTKENRKMAADAWLRRAACAEDGALREVIYLESGSRNGGGRRGGEGGGVPAFCMLYSLNHWPRVRGGGGAFSPRWQLPMVNRSVFFCQWWLRNIFSIVAIEHPKGMNRARTAYIFVTKGHPES